MPSEQFFSYIMVRTFWRDDDDVRFVLDQQAELNFYSASPLKQQFAGRRRSTRIHYPDSEPTRLCSYSL